MMERRKLDNNHNIIVRTLPTVGMIIRPEVGIFILNEN